MLNELQQVEWKLGRPFDPVEVASLDNYFGSDLERILSWLTDRMKLVCESVRMQPHSGGGLEHLSALLSESLSLTDAFCSFQIPYELLSIA